MQELFGIGLRSPHYGQILQEKPHIGWLEVHSENFFADGGELHKYMEKLRSNYEVSFHGVGLSLGSAEGINKGHLKNLKFIVDKFQPFMVSEHISWSNIAGHSYNDLLPVPYNKEAADKIVENIQKAQEYLGLQIGVENPSTYLQFKSSDMTECEFMNYVADKADCKILFDVNNVYVGAFNHGFSAEAYIDDIDVSKINEIHLAGHSKVVRGNSEIIIDTHSDYICNDVWDLYRKAIQRIGKVHTMIEWDDNIPALGKLISESHKAYKIAKEVIYESGNPTAAIC